MTLYCGSPITIAYGQMIILTLRSDVSRKVQVQQSKQKLVHGNTKPLCSFEVGDLVKCKLLE